MFPLLLTVLYRIHDLLCGIGLQGVVVVGVRGWGGGANGPWISRVVEEEGYATLSDSSSLNPKLKNRNPMYFGGFRGPA